MTHPMKAFSRLIAALAIAASLAPGENTVTFSTKNAEDVR